MEASFEAGPSNWASKLPQRTAGAPSFSQTERSSKGKRARSHKLQCGCLCFCGLALVAGLTPAYAHPSGPYPPSDQLDRLSKGKDVDPEWKEGARVAIEYSEGQKIAQTELPMEDALWAAMKQLGLAEEVLRQQIPSSSLSEGLSQQLLAKQQTPTIHRLARRDAPSLKNPSIAPSGWTNRKHKTDFYAVPIIIAASAVLAIFIVITLFSILACMRRRSEKQKVLEQSDTERNSIDNDKPDIDHQEDDQGILPEVQQLPERPGRKRKGLMKVTKQRITAVRRRRQPRKEPSPLTTPAEPTEQAVEPVSQSSPTSETTQCPQEPSGTSTAVQVLTESSSSPDSADQQYSQHPETPSPPVSPGPSMPPAEPPAYASPASASPVPSARQLEKRRAHMDASREASASLDEGATASSTTTPDELFQSSISQINRPEYDHTMYSGHVATDDKALLAQRSTLASAPSHDNHIESTPTTSAHFSAPEVEVDYDGYEIHDHPEPPPEPPVHGDLPAPPTAMNQSSIPVATLPPQLREASAPDFGDHVSEEPSAPEGWLPLPLYEAREEERSDDLHNPILRGSQNGSSEHGLRLSGIDV